MAFLERNDFRNRQSEPNPIDMTPGCSEACFYLTKEHKVDEKDVNSVPWSE